MPDDITDSTAGIVFNNTDSPTISPKDSPLENRAPPSGNSSSGLDGHSAIEKLFHEATEPPKEPEEGEGDETPPEKEEEKAAEEKAPPKPPVKPAPEAKKEPPPQEEKKPGVEEQPKNAPEEPKDKLAEVKLPPHAKPGTVKSFDEVKRRAREEITKLSNELNEVKAKLPKPGQALPPELAKELEELRTYRKVHDYQNDPEFKKTYIDSIAANHKTILGKLKQNGYTDEQLAKITEIGIDKLDWDPVVAALPTATRRSIESLLVENERISDKKAQALEDAKNAPVEFAAKQKQAEIDRKTQEDSTVQQTLDTILPKLDWFKETPIPATATTEQKSEIEAKNAFHKEQTDRLSLMLKDTSPQMRGQMIAATLLAYQKQNEAVHYKARFERADAELQKIRKASATRSSRNAPAPGEVPNARPGLFARGSDALDTLHKQMTSAD